MEPLAKAAKKREDELNQQAATSVKMVKRIEGRFYWAPLLAELTQVVPREVQITRLTGELTGDSVRRCSLSIDGLSAGTDPRRVAEDLRTAIADRLSPRYNNVTSTFKTLEDGSEMVMLDGKQVGTATFAIIVQLTTREDAPAAPHGKRNETRQRRNPENRPRRLAAAGRRVQLLRFVARPAHDACGTDPAGYRRPRPRDCQCQSPGGQDQADGSGLPQGHPPHAPGPGDDPRRLARRLVSDPAPRISSRSRASTRPPRA